MPYTMRPLSCDPARVKGMSERLIVSHYENNYGGAVKRLNFPYRRFGWISQFEQSR
jgi:superoxide dismutase, Fe-Mn family